MFAINFHLHCLIACFIVPTLILGGVVTNIQPRTGSLAGETRITIFGLGFSANQFSQSDDPAVGNRVYLVGESGSEVVCKTHRDGCTKTQLMCYTPTGMQQQKYYVKVVVDNETIPDSNLCGGDPISPACTYLPRVDYSPSIKSFTPLSGPPGGFVRFEGKIMTDRYGSNVEASSSGRAQKLLRVYVGPQDCGLKNGDDLWGLNLTSPGISNLGYIVCKTKGTSIGFFNASFIVESPFGRSVTEFDKYLVSYKDDIFMYQVYASILSVSPSYGSVSGGLTLTIRGNYFDERPPYVPAQAYIEDSVCKITKVKLDEYIECTVPPSPGYSKYYYRGNRGAEFEYWQGVTKSATNINSILSMPTTHPAYRSKFIDESYYTDTKAYYSSRMTFFFHPPKTGGYIFQLFGDNMAKMYLNGVARVTSSQKWESSPRIVLYKRDRYRIQIIHFQLQGTSTIHLKAKSSETSITSNMVGKASQERQLIKVSSEMVYEYQVLSFNGFLSQRAVQEIQKIEVKTYGSYRLGLYGVYTEPLPFDADVNSVRTAFNALPIWMKNEKVKVERSQTATPTFTFTFLSSRGDFPDIHVRGVGDDANKNIATVTEIRKGLSDGKTIALMLDNRITQPLTATKMSGSILHRIINDLRKAKCPPVFESAYMRQFYQDYERGRGTFSGQITSSTEPFCGLSCLLNPNSIYLVRTGAGIKLASYRMLCFAYKGILKNEIILGFYYYESGGKRKYTTRSYSHIFKKDSPSKSTTWYYTCFDMAANIGTTRAFVMRIRVSQGTKADIYIDSTFVGKRETLVDDEINLRRLPAIKPNNFLMRSIYVRYRRQTKDFIVALRPYNCGFGFPLFELANGILKSGDSGKESKRVTFGLSNGGKGTFEAIRQTFASPPIDGLIDITVKGATRKDLDLTGNSQNIQTQLESLPGIGALSVVKTGDCSNFNILVDFLTLPGDVPLMSVTNNRLTGNKVAIKVIGIADGGLFYDPLTGDMISTIHRKPQVRVLINDVPTACSGDCTFEWGSSKTPAVYSISPSKGTSALNTKLAIKGIGFDSTPSNNQVTIGGVPCDVTSSSSNQISCTVGNGPVGEHKVHVTVFNKGDADHGKTIKKFMYTAALSSISPNRGSLGGGQLLTVTGYGFKTGAAVTINDKPCSVVSVSPAKLTCKVPSSRYANLYPVKIVQGSVTLTHSGFTYDNSLTAVVSSVNPLTIPVTGSYVQIRGSKFGNIAYPVLAGTEPVNVTAWSDRQIDIETGLLSAGVKDLKIETGNGYAVNKWQNLPKLNAKLQVTNVYPLKGSIQGGTTLTITGFGFGSNISLVDVNVGRVPCDMKSVSNTQLTCQITNTGTVHRITNGGTSRAFGVYYAFDKPYIVIERGDFIQWSWHTPTFVKNVAHAIIQVESPGAIVGMPGGFNSGAPTKNGQFSYQFNQVGEFYVWSGFTDSWEIKNYAGTVKVVESKSSLRVVHVKMAGKPAEYVVGGSGNPPVTLQCNKPKTSCPDKFPTGEVAAKFNYAFWSCSTPLITGIDQKNGTTQTTLTITGEGFSTICDNEVTIGDANCKVITATDTQITCQIAKSGEPAVGVYQPVSLRVVNRGTAVVNIMSLEEKSFALIPNIDNIHPESGSIEGGALLTLSGFGLIDSPYVTVNNYQCIIVAHSYTEVVCETPKSTKQHIVEISVTVNIGGGPYPVKCETSSRLCKYAYLIEQTASVTSISPSSTSGFLSFTIAGSGLGSTIEDIKVRIGSENASVIAVSDNSITGIVPNLPVGENQVIVSVKDYGRAAGSLSITSNAAITAVNPAVGSIHGETTLTILGNGFIVDQTTVTIGDSNCTVKSVSLSQLVCVTTPHAGASVNVEVTSNGVSFPLATYTYAVESTPNITSISPTSGVSGDTLTITGVNLYGAIVSVSIEGSPCVITTSSPTEIVCTVGGHETGSRPIKVHVMGFGASNVDVNFEYALDLNDINPKTGGIAGGQIVTLSGSGFESTASVTIGTAACDYINHTTTEYYCKTQGHTDGPCNVTLTLNGLTKSLTDIYIYDNSITAVLSGVSPSRGGTGGGTPITITGTGFGTTLSAVKVTIDEVECVASSVVDTQIECLTGEHIGSMETKINVEVGGNGIARAANSSDDDFWYIDVWSSNFTWGGGPIPEAGEFVVIPSGQILLLDTDTPVLKFLLIQGGKLIFDDKDLELNSEIIMLTDGGVLQVGTEDEPFQYKAIITLHGHHRSKELPIYGTKVLAVRNGTLDLHGTFMPIMWTRLASTSAAGSNTLQLQQPVEWNVGDEIVIASTGHFHSQSENEKKVIQSVSGDKMTLTLTSPLQAKHVGEEETFDGTLVEFRGEVGLLTHNVVVRGNADPQWETEIKACEAGFDTGEFVTQTCFQGRFGDEMGSSQFGAMIFVHSSVRNTQIAVARLSYIEVTHAGQAFRLGRYPIHFHLNGKMSLSYVRGVSIHHTFNRAVNIHGVHDTLIEHTVLYNVMGGAFFLEDGIETGNTLQYNLAVFVRESSSLLNDDITPASFWVTHPKNYIRHNAAAGGSHFGYWYRMHTHPEGPSYTRRICPKREQLGAFYNNTAHSFGWFGFWIFPDYYPKDKRACGSVKNKVAVFKKIFSWNNDKGAETVNTGALQFIDCVFVQNRMAGYEGKTLGGVPHFDGNSAMLKDSLIVGHTTVIPDSIQNSTAGGVVLAYGFGFQLINVRFINFRDDTTSIKWTTITGKCFKLCAGFTYHTTNLTFINVPNRIRARWDWEGVIVDRDGSLTGKSESDWKLLPTATTLPTDCEPYTLTSIGHPISICPPNHVFHRLGLNGAAPKVLHGKNFLFTNQYGKGSAAYRQKAVTHRYGWAVSLLSGETYTWEFQDAPVMVNMSWISLFYEFEPDDYIIVKIKASELPDRVSVDKGKTFIPETVGVLDPSTGVHGNWTWDNTQKEISILIHGSSSRSKRDVSGRHKRDASMNGTKVEFDFKMYKCFFPNCVKPEEPDKIGPQPRPVDYDFYDNPTMWKKAADGYITNDPELFRPYGNPKENDNVKVVEKTWVIVASTNMNKLGTLLLEGVLEFMDTPGKRYELSVKFIIIRGGRLVIGTPLEPFQASASIILRGNIESPLFSDGEESVTVTPKAIAAYGGIDLHGKDKGLTWTKLAKTAGPGGRLIVLVDTVGWEAGDDIVIGPTSYNVWETESFKIARVESDMKTLTLNATLRYRHVAHTETIKGQTITLAAAVGLLTHNIKVIGADYPNLYKENFGGRIFVGMTVFNERTYTGYARVSNVEFYHMGQEGYYTEVDPRFALAYMGTGLVTDIKPSNVSKCSFHNGFNSAIGAFGANGLNITDNVVFGSIGHAIRTHSEDTRLINNMVALVVWTGTYQGRKEVFNYNNEAGIEAVGSTRLILHGNLVTGSERYGFHVPPQNCTDTSDDYKDNVAQGNVMGVGVLPKDELPKSDCLKFQNFVAWKNFDYGIYYQHDPSFVADNNIVVENGNGYMLHVLGPSATEHLYADKTIEIRNGLVVGATSSFDCNLDRVKIIPNLNIKTSEPVPAPNGGRIGIVFPNFMTGSNNAPIVGWSGIMTYPAINGLMKLKNLTFAHFKPNSCNGSFAISTNYNNDDGQHPVYAEQISLFDVDERNKIAYHRPNLGLINSADCVDMDCDAMKKALFKDLDGSFLGSPGAVIPQSEYEWGGDPRRGLGYERIPKAMVTTEDGEKIPYEVLATNKGIFRGPGCSFVDSWTAYKCHGIDYAMLIIESLDEDSTTRRLSPVAILSESDLGTERYIDLINGPQDHGWCSGYACRRRLSTFMAIVATGRNYLLYFTAPTPKNMRYHLLNVADDVGIKLTVYYSIPNGLDVFADGKYVMATNGKIENGNYIQSIPIGDEFQPTLVNVSGTNFCDRNTGLLSIIIKGSKAVEVITREAVVVSFGMPALSTEEFFGTNMVENIAGFFNIPLTKVRVVNVKGAQSKKRRRRDASDMQVTLEISDEPGTETPDVPASETNQTVSLGNGTVSSNSSATNETDEFDFPGLEGDYSDADYSDVDIEVSDKLDHDNLVAIASDIVNECQGGQIAAVLNLAGSCGTVTVPPANATEPPVTYKTPSPRNLVMHIQPDAHYEGVPLTIQPIIHAVDVDNAFVTPLGTAEFPWQLEVGILYKEQHSKAYIGGLTVANASDGWFNFSDVSVSLMGDEYVLEFHVIFPLNAVNFTVQSGTFNVAAKPVKASVKSTSEEAKVMNQPFSTTLNLHDALTNEVIYDINWRGHTWVATAEMLGSGEYGDLSGNLSETFNVATGEALFSNLIISGQGVYYLQFTVLSTPTEYNFTVKQKVVTINPKHVGMEIEERSEVKLKFDADYDEVISSPELLIEFETFMMQHFISTFGDDVVIESSHISPGSIVVTFVIAGNATAVNQTRNNLCGDVLNGTSYTFNGHNLPLSPYMTVNNASYLGVSCGAKPEEDSGLSAGTIVGIAIGGVVILLLLLYPPGEGEKGVY